MDPFSPTGISGLQSGFVLAAILLAVFFAERLGGSAVFAQRGFQVVLGVALAFLVISATTAFDRAPELPPELQGAFLQEQTAADEDEALALFQESGRATARNASEVRTIHTGLGLLFVLAAVALFSRLRVLPAGFLLGGLLLLLFGSPMQAGGLGGFLDFFMSLFGALGGGASGPGQARDIAYFAVLLFGTVALAAFGYVRWERESAPAAAPTPSV